MRKINHKIILIIIVALLIAIIPNFSKAAKVSVGKVKNLKTTNIETTSATLTWKKVSGATGYRAYIYNDNTKKYDYYGKVKTNKITIKKIKSSKRYKVKVRAYKTKNGKKYFGAYSGMCKFATKPKKMKNLTIVAQTPTSIQLSWSNVARATGYRAYILNEKTNKYDYYGKVKTNSINITNLDPAKTYKLKMRAYRELNGTNYYGEYTYTQIATKPMPIMNLRLKENNSKTITITWDAVGRATAYKIYRYNEKTKVWDYCGKTKNLSYAFTKPAKEEGYKFRVRAYIDFNGKQLFGTYSNIFSTRVGMDVSYYNGNIDWQKVKDAGISFAVIKAAGRGYGNGKIYDDSKFKRNIEEAIKHGVEVAIYFYSASINEKEAKEEAQYCIDIIKKYKLENKCKYIAYDFEEYGKHRTSNITKKQMDKNHIAFLKKVKDAGYIPVLYANKSYLTNYLDVDSILKAVPNTKIWLAHWGTGKSSYVGNYDIWQYTSDGSVNGITGRVDLDIIYF